MSTDFLRSAALGAALFSVSLPAMAAGQGPYFGVRGGVNFQSGTPAFSDSVTTGFPPIFFTTTAATTSVDTDTGFNAGIVGGYSFGNFGMVSPRFEAEFGYLSNSADTSDSNVVSTLVFFGAPTVTTTNSTNDATSGELNARYGLASLLLDIPVGGPLTPFIGGGIGFANARFSNITPQTGGNAGNIVADDEDTVFAWSVTAGASYALTQNISLDLSYRYLRFDSLETNSTNGSTINSNDIENHQVNLGVRYSF